MKSACSFLCLLVFKPKLSLPRFLCHSGPTWANLGPNHFCISYICILYIWFYFESHKNLELHGFMRLACQAKKIDARDCFSYMELEDLMLVSGFSNQLQKRRSRSFALLAALHQWHNTFSQQWQWGFLPAASKDCSPQRRYRCSVHLSLLENLGWSLQSMGGKPGCSSDNNLYIPTSWLISLCCVQVTYQEKALLSHFVSSDQNLKWCAASTCGFKHSTTEIQSKLVLILQITFIPLLNGWGYLFGINFWSQHPYFQIRNSFPTYIL